jgi:Fur family transcriptional regulator, ferric uptake regulator
MTKSAVEQLSLYLAGQGLRSTSQRDAILKTFIEAGQHLSAEELYARVKKTHPGIGYATIYRTLKLLAEAGLVEERRFEDGFTRFEYKNKDAHHDHLICTRCGAIIEFENDRIEALQHDVARQKGFKVQSHKLELYGLCAACGSSKDSSM